MFKVHGNRATPDSAVGVRGPVFGAGLEARTLARPAEKEGSALTDVAQGVGPHPEHQRFNSQSGHLAGLQAGPQLGTCERQPIDVSLAHLCFSLSLSLPSPLSKNK